MNRQEGERDHNHNYMSRLDLMMIIYPFDSSSNKSRSSVVNIVDSIIIFDA